MDKALGHPCQHLACKNNAQPNKKVCFWHDPTTDKTGDDIKPRLEKMVREGRSLAGFRLARANLEGINLVGKPGSSGTDLSHVDFYRANLKGAHLYRANMRRASLLKADLSGANLNFANLSGANMLGLRLDYCRMEHVVWGRTIFQEEQLARKNKQQTPAERNQLFSEAEEVCRSVRRSCESHGLFDDAGHFFHKEMTFRRYQYSLGSWQRWMSKLVDLLSGYGERPFRVVVFSSVLVMMCALFYFIAGVQSGDEVIRYEMSSQLGQNWFAFLDALYFSVVTFTTLGYGDLTPLGPSRTLAALEAFIGNFSLALFVVVFVKKMTR